MSHVCHLPSVLYVCVCHQVFCMLIVYVIYPVSCKSSEPCAIRCVIVMSPVCHMLQVCLSDVS